MKNYYVNPRTPSLKKTLKYIIINLQVILSSGEMRATTRVQSWNNGIITDIEETEIFISDYFVQL